MTTVRRLARLSDDIACPACRSRDVRPSSKRALWLVRLLGLNRFRCRTCRRRVLVRARA